MRCTPILRTRILHRGRPEYSITPALPNDLLRGRINERAAQAINRHCLRLRVHPLRKHDPVLARFSLQPLDGQEACLLQLKKYRAKFLSVAWMYSEIGAVEQPATGVQSTVTDAVLIQSIEQSGKERILARIESFLVCCGLN